MRITEESIVQFRFHTKWLESLYFEGKNVHKLPPEVIDAFFEKMAIIAAATDIRDFYALKSLHFEKLTGKRSGERSMRLNKQWRLIVRTEQDEQGNLLLILNIEDYH